MQLGIEYYHKHSKFINRTREKFIGIKYNHKRIVHVSDMSLLPHKMRNFLILINCFTDLFAHLLVSSIFLCFPLHSVLIPACRIQKNAEVDKTKNRKNPVEVIKPPGIDIM